MAIKAVCNSIIEIRDDCCSILKGAGAFFSRFLFSYYLPFLVSLNNCWSYLKTGAVSFVGAQHEVSRFRCCFVVLPAGDGPLKGEEIALG